MQSLPAVRSCENHGSLKQAVQQLHCNECLSNAEMQLSHVHYSCPSPRQLAWSLCCLWKHVRHFSQTCFGYENLIWDEATDFFFQTKHDEAMFHYLAAKPGLTFQITLVSDCQSLQGNTPPTCVIQTLTHYFYDHQIFTHLNNSNHLWNIILHNFDFFFPFSLLFPFSVSEWSTLTIFIKV